MITKIYRWLNVINKSLPQRLEVRRTTINLEETSIKPGIYTNLSHPFTTLTFMRYRCMTIFFSLFSFSFLLQDVRTKLLHPSCLTVMFEYASVHDYHFSFNYQFSVSSFSLPPSLPPSIPPPLSFSYILNHFFFWFSFIFPHEVSTPHRLPFISPWRQNILATYLSPLHHSRTTGQRHGNSSPHVSDFTTQ